MKAALAVLLVVAGCYNPAALDGTACAIRCGASDACPDSRPCVGGFCLLAGEVCASPGDASPLGDAVDGTVDDAPLDGRLARTSCVPGTYGNPASMPAVATGYTTHAGVAAYVQAATGNILVDGVLAFSSAYHEPRLGTVGTELFMVDDTLGLHRSTKLAGVWSSPGVITTTNLASFIPGTVSATTPRHMIVSTGGNGFYEGVETTIGGTWTFTALAISGFTNVIEPSLSDDGLRVVFIGKMPDGGTGIDVAWRTTLGGPFTGATQLFDLLTAFPTGNPHVPFLPSDDCQYLFFSVDGVEYRS